MNLQLFTLAELRLLLDFKLTHESSCGEQVKVITRQRSSAGIGLVTETTCPHCNQIDDITDYHSW